MTSVVPGMIEVPSFLLFSRVVVWRALAFLSAVLASCWFLVICVAISSAAGCNDPTIGSYNDYHLSPNGIPSGNQRWYGLVYLVYK